MGDVAVSQPVHPFRIFTHDFWLNLHSFLYVLGRDQNRTPDRMRLAVVNAPKEAARVLDDATEADRALWQEAVEFYAKGPSTLDAVFDARLPIALGDLAAAGDGLSLSGVNPDHIGADWRAMLERVAPVYRRLFWPAHRLANETWSADIDALVVQYGAGILAELTRAFGESWPANGFPVHVSGYANWAGAFSIEGGVLVLSSLHEGIRGTSGLETIFHEGMHQWDEATAARLARAAAVAGVKVPDNLSHALIFYTAGDAVRRAVPGYVPYTEVNNMWPRLGPSIKAALDAAWQPFLDGRGDRDAALVEVLRRAAKIWQRLPAGNLRPAAARACRRSRSD